MTKYTSREDFLNDDERNISVELTKKQKDWALGIMLSDGWVTGQYLHLAQSLKTLAFLYAAKDVFGVLATEPAEHKNDQGIVDSKRIRIGPLPQFAHLGRMFYPFGNWNPNQQTFYPIGGKIMPTVSWLNERLNEESLAVWIMGDGSIKSETSKAIEIHTQGLPLESAARGAISIYETTGITCKISTEPKRVPKDAEKKGKNLRNVPLKKDPSGTVVPVIFVCGENIEKLISRIKPRMERDLQYKIPPPRKRAYYQRKPSDCYVWYLENKDQTWRDDVSSCIAWREKKNKEKQARKNDK